VLPGFLVPPAPDSGATTPTWIPLGAAPVPYSASALTAATSVPIDPAALATATTGSFPIFGVLTLPGGGDGGAPNPIQYPGGNYPLGPDGGLVFVQGDLLGLPTSAVQSLSRWDLSTADGSTPPSFTGGLTYSFALLGDPQAQPLAVPNPDGGSPIRNPNYDGRGLHFVAFPNKFAMPQ
jgi:hypothetical protein